MADIDGAISQLQDLIATSSTALPDDLSKWLQSLAQQYNLRFGVTGDLNDLEASIQQMRQALDLTSEDHPERIPRLEDLRAYHFRKFSRTKTLPDAEALIEATRHVLEVAEGEHPSRGSWYHDLGFAYNYKCEVSRSLADAELSLEYYQKSLDLAAHDDPARVHWLMDLADAHQCRFDMTKRMEDVDACIRLYQESISIGPLTENNRPTQFRQLNWLGYAYRQRFERNDSLADIDQCIHCYVKSLDLAASQSDRGDVLNDIARCFQERYRRSKDITDLEICVQYDQEALKLAVGDGSRRDCRLQELAHSLILRYHEIGATADLEQSMQYLVEAIGMWPDNHPGRADLYTSLERVHVAMFERTKGLSDLDEALQCARAALDLTPEHSPLRVSRLKTLAKRYRERHSITRSDSDLENSSSLLLEVLENTPEGHPDRARCLRELGHEFWARFQKAGAFADADRSIEYYQGALDIIAQDDPFRHDYLYGIGTAIYSKYRATQADSDLNASISYLLQALDSIPDGHYNRGLYLDWLGGAYEAIYDKTERAEDLDRVIQNQKAAFTHSPQSEYHRFIRGKYLFKFYNLAEDWASAYETATEVMSLIPSIAPRSLANSDKQHQLRDLVGFASDAAASALMAGRSAYEAIQLLELGRGVIIGSLSDIRSDLSGLQQQHPSLADQYLHLRDRLDTPITAENSTERYDTAKEFEYVLEDIREQPGFGRFLLAPTEDELMAAATSGSIVIINVSQDRCDAFVICGTGLETVELPDLDYFDIEDYLKDFGSRLASTDVLEWLWDAIAEPVLDCLGLTETPRQDWPRIWWIPVGPLAKFPIHAAGYHTDGSGRTVLDRAVSSYSSSAKALIHSQQTIRGAVDRRQPPEKGKAVLLGMETTPGQKTLPFVSQEVAKLGNICGAMELAVAQPEPHREDVLSALKGCKIFHFAGHGRTDPSDPLKSSLIVRDGSLTVASLFDINLQGEKPFMAYLSACGTGQIKDDRFVDEGLHLISACQLAGFRHVLGSLWEVNDQSCVDVAVLLYEWMKTHQVSDASVSGGLHHAAMALRDSWVLEGAARRNHGSGKDSSRRHSDWGGGDADGKILARDIEEYEDHDNDDLPLHWVPYVHFGL